MRWHLLLVLAVCLLWAANVEAAGVAIEAGQVILDFGTVAPGQPHVLPKAMQFAVRSEALWHLNVRAQGDLLSEQSQSMPIERLSWALAGGEPPQWQTLSHTDQPVLANQLPTNEQAQTVALDLRLNPAWTDVTGGPFRTNLLVTLVAGTDLVPSYTWPQPYNPGREPLYFTFFVPTDTSAICLRIHNGSGSMVAEQNEVVHSGWVTIGWSGSTLDGELVAPGNYTYSIHSDDILLAQGVFEVAVAPQAVVGQITGYVNASSAVSGASVFVYDQQRRLVASTLSDDCGGFTFTQLPVGTYWLEVSYPGYITWVSPPLFITKAEPNQHIEVNLTANNALFVTASISNRSPSATLQAGDLIEVSGEVRNTGTRSLRWPMLEVAWPAGVQPLAHEVGGFTTQVDSPPLHMQQVQLPDLAPGAKVAYRLLAVVKLSAPAQAPASLHLIAHASAVQPDTKALLPVQSPPRMVQIPGGFNRADTSGMLALYIFWDENGDGQVGPNEAPAAYTRFTLSDGQVVTTDSSGWLRCRVPTGPISLYFPGNQTEPQVVYAGLVSPNGFLTGQVGLRKESATQRAGAVLGGELVAGRLQWQGAGLLAQNVGNWHLVWQPPGQLVGAKMGVNRNHQWSVSIKREQPALKWRTQMADLPQEGRRPATVSVTLGVSGQPAWQKAKWSAAGFGPYNFPTSVADVQRVVIYIGDRSKELSLADYTWSPSGQLWLAEPILSLGASMGGSESVWLEALYVPEQNNEQASAASYHVDIRATPERTDAEDDHGAALWEEFRLQWQRTPKTCFSTPSWLLTWTREYAGTRLRWQGGSGLALEQGEHTWHMESGRYNLTWPPPYKIEWEKTIGRWQLSASHQLLRTGRYQTAALRYHWPLASTRNNHGDADWQWQGEGPFNGQLRLRASGDWQARQANSHLAVEWHRRALNGEGSISLDLTGGRDTSLSGQWQAAGWFASWQLLWEQSGYTHASLAVWRTKSLGEQWQLSGQLGMESRHLHNWGARSLLVKPALTVRWQNHPKRALAVGGEWPRLVAGTWQEVFSCNWVGVEWQVGQTESGNLNWWINLQLRQRQGELAPAIYFFQR